MAKGGVKQARRRWEAAMACFFQKMDPEMGKSIKESNMLDKTRFVNAEIDLTALQTAAAIPANYPHEDANKNWTKKLRVKEEMAIQNKQ